MNRLLAAISFLSLLSCHHPKVQGNQEPKGEILFTSRRDDNFEVYLMQADSSSPRRLTHDPKTDYAVAWAPDGRYLLFYSNRSGNEEIYRMNPDGSGITNLSNHPGSDRSASVSPNGKLITFAATRDTKEPEIYLMHADGSRQQALTRNGRYCESPVFTRDGKQIIFTLLADASADSTDKNNYELYIMNLDGSQQRRLTHKKGYDSGADPSPNGKQIAFYGRSEAGHSDIFIMNRDGSGVTNLTQDAQEDYSPSWSPDGQWIAYTSGSAANYDIWIINPRTRERRRLTTQPKRDESPYWKPMR